MQDVQFTPDAQAHVHTEGAIDLICSQFRSHEEGLPEWLKNASDMYRRRNARREESVILVLFKNGSRNSESRVGCIDFGGMTTHDIEGRFRQWADPDAAGGNDAAGVQGGHGNGGKCYMTQMFESHAYIHTLKNSRANKYGFLSGRVVPGYFPSPEDGRDYEVENPTEELNAALSLFGLSLDDLPESVKKVWHENQGFTLVVGFGAKQYQRKLPVSTWVDNLRGHQQMVQVIQRCTISAFHNGKLLDNANPMDLPVITPIPGAENGRTIGVPESLIDPSTGEEVSTGADAEKSRLELRTSDVSMRWSLKARHTINGWTSENRATGYWDVPLLSRSAYANKIYGDLYLDDLEKYKQNDRRRHSDSPLIRAITEWVSVQIEKYSADFVKLDRLQASKEEKDELSRMNEALNRWKNQFLEQEFGGLGKKTPGPGPSPKPRPRLPRGEPSTVILRLTHTMAGRGVDFRPSIEFFDVNGLRIRAVPYEWEVTDYNIAFADPDLNTISTFTAGKVEIAVKCKDSKLRSNTVTLEVLDILDIDLQPSELEIRAGSRSPITAKVHTRDGREVEGVYLIWAESNSDCVSVGSGGMVFGLQPGVSTVTAGDDQMLSSRPVNVTVTQGITGGGSGFPLILLSEIDTDPLGDAPPTFSNAGPPVHQRPQDVDANIWWINMASPLARRYIDTAREGGAHSKEWRVYHLERYIEVMVKILLTYDFEHGEELTFETMLRRWDEEAVNMQTRAVESLRGYLDEGILPEVT